MSAGGRISARPANIGARGSLWRLRAVAALLAPLVLGGCAGAAPHASTRPPASPPALARVWPVMGTALQGTVWEADTARARAALLAARAAVFRIDTLMSVYRPESELSIVNRRAGTDTATVVSHETAEVLAAALEVAEQSGGALDVTVGPLVDVWGFYRRAGRIPPRAVRDSAARLVGWRRIEFGRATRRVRLPVRGMRLDFGGIAKGYAVDAGVAALRAAGISRGMVDLGGNIRVFGTPPSGARWRLGLRDPRAPDEIFAVVSLDSGAVATSGDYEQFFLANGVRYSHLFDPRTGEPSRAGVAAVSVVAPTGLLSDAWGKPLYVLGIEAGCQLAARLPGIDAVWVRDEGADAGDGTAPPRVIVTRGMVGRLELAEPDAESVEPLLRACGPRR